MKPTWLRTSAVALLAAFAGISLVYAAVQEIRRAPAVAAVENPLQTGQQNVSGLDALKGGKSSVTIYYATYYHGNVRCPTCMKIEAYSKEAIETGFAKEIAAGKVKYRMLNYDEKGNEHYKKDYELAAQSLIVSEVSDGKEKRWKNLEKVWDLTYDKDKFVQYVEDEFKAFIKVKSKTTSDSAQAAPVTVVEASADVPSAASTPAAKHIVVYYLHGDTRCPSCVKIEKFANAAVHERFADEIKAGQVEWRAVNYDEPENRHYWLDFGLEVKTVVVEEVVDGEQARFKRLDDVWYLLGDEQEFADFVEQEVRQYLEGVA